jgi:hypothetical protein
LSRWSDWAAARFRLRESNGQVIAADAPTVEVNDED